MARKVKFIKKYQIVVFKITSSYLFTRPIFPIGVAGESSQTDFCCYYPDGHTSPQGVYVSV